MDGDNSDFDDKASISIALVWLMSSALSNNSAIEPDGWSWGGCKQVS